MLIPDYLHIIPDKILVMADNNSSITNTMSPFHILSFYKWQVHIHMFRRIQSA